MKIDFPPEIENPCKIPDITFKAIVHVTTDIKIMKQISDTEMTYLENNKKNHQL